MLSTWEAENDCETCGYDSFFYFTQWNYSLQTGGKITQNVGEWEIVNYIPGSF